MYFKLTATAHPVALHPISQREMASGPTLPDTEVWADAETRRQAEGLPPSTPITLRRRRGPGSVVAQARAPIAEWQAAGVPLQADRGLYDVGSVPVTTDIPPSIIQQLPVIDGVIPQGTRYYADREAAPLAGALLGKTPDGSSVYLTDHVGEDDEGADLYEGWCLVTLLP